ncbi:hypothetical protein MAUB_30730 [Mycolicibacterium aubagnense]|uniref:Uncharacterized protein n=1 Tax=Mycolicibacterium aubagnense TaxID=319707 RepID=A0ABM7IEW2_9MYCO|nr:hypothetical protein MAUB_30730 [Mycolicibacterium aubagnense]
MPRLTGSAGAFGGAAATLVAGPSTAHRARPTPATTEADKPTKKRRRLSSEPANRDPGVVE